MSKFTRSLVLLVGGGFVLLSLLSAAKGQYSAAFGALVLGGLVAFFGGIGWFSARFRYRRYHPVRRLQPLFPS